MSARTSAWTKYAHNLSSFERVIKHIHFAYMK